MSWIKLLLITDHWLLCYFMTTFLFSKDYLLFCKLTHFQHKLHKWNNGTCSWICKEWKVEWVEIKTGWMLVCCLWHIKALAPFFWLYQSKSDYQHNLVFITCIIQITYEYLECSYFQLSPFNFYVYLCFNLRFLKDKKILHILMWSETEQLTCIKQLKSLFSKTHSVHLNPFWDNQVLFLLYGQR